MLGISMRHIDMTCGIPDERIRNNDSSCYLGLMIACGILLDKERIWNIKGFHNRLCCYFWQMKLFGIEGMYVPCFSSLETMLKYLHHFMEYKPSFFQWTANENQTPFSIRPLKVANFFPSKRGNSWYKWISTGELMTLCQSSFHSRRPI